MIGADQATPVTVPDGPPPRLPRLLDMAGWTLQHTVTEADTAIAVGSGGLPVLATPTLVAWLEQAAYQVAQQELADGQTSVGTLVEIEHVKASPVGSVITCRCSAPMSDGRRLRFDVSVQDAAGAELARGRMHRHVVDAERFLSRVIE